MLDKDCKFKDGSQQRAIHKCFRGSVSESDIQRLIRRVLFAVYPLLIHYNDSAELENSAYQVDKIQMKVAICLHNVGLWVY